MGLLTIYKDNYSDSTIVSNRFIDDYMKDANEAEIKVYLYLLRMMSANMPTSIQDIADRFNHTEREVMRALKYWEKCNLLRLESTDGRTVSGIRFLAPAPIEEVIAERTPAQIVPLRVVSDMADSVAVKEPVKAQPVAKESVTYTREQLNSFKNDAQTGQIVFIAEAYLNRTLSVTDIQTLYFIYDELKFSPELIDTLLQVCIDNDKKDIRYIKKVAMDWAEKGISTVEEAKAHSSGRYEKYVYSVLNALGRTSAPVKQEADYVIRWYKEYGFPIDVINEACSRTVKATDSHRLEYCEKILSSWKKAGVKEMADIITCDENYKKNKTERSASTRNSFNNFDNKTNYNFDELENILIN